jgi:biopolymer transport protein ExbD
MDFDSIGRRHFPEPDLVPILDALTSVIFFLLLSATFMTLTKLTVPPATVASLKSTEAVPLNPMYIVSERNGELILKLTWKGVEPGEIRKQVARVMPRNQELFNTTQLLMAEFAKKFIDQKTMQISLSSQIQYQELITVMDGIRRKYQDIVLGSPDLANATGGVITE